MPDDQERGLRQQILETVQVAMPGAALGACGGPVVAYTTFIAFGLFPAHSENLVAGLIWRLFVGFPFGLFAGGCVGVFVGLRARHIDSLRRSVIETVSLAAVGTVVVTESLLTRGYTNVQRFRVGLAVALVSAGLIMIAMRMLKPLLAPMTISQLLCALRGLCGCFSTVAPAALRRSGGGSRAASVA